MVNGVLISILLFLFTGNFKDTTLAYAGRYVLFHASGFKHASNDSWKPMIAASEHLHESPEEPLYSKVFFDWQGLSYCCLPWKTMISDRAIYGTHGPEPLAHFPGDKLKQRGIPHAMLRMYPTLSPQFFIF